MVDVIVSDWINILADAASLTEGGAGLLLPVMVLLPLLGAILLAFLKEDEAVETWALAISGILFVLSLIAAFLFRSSGAMAWSTPWISPFGVNFAFQLDWISLWLILLSTFLMPLTILGSFGDDRRGRTREFYIWLLVLESALIGVFAAGDLILFYVFFEMTLLPLYFLIGIFGGTKKDVASIKFFLFTLAGSVFTLVALLYVAWFHVASNLNASWTFDIATLTASAQGMSLTQQGWVLAGLLAGFAVKVPLFPVHTWLPLAHTQAPTAGSVILAGVLLKLGSYGLLRFALPLAPDAVVEYAPQIAALCVVGVVYAALICWVQTNIKQLIAYSSVSHMGFCILGMFALNLEGLSGSVMYMINHGLSTGALFLCVGMIYNRYHTLEIDQLSGLGRRMPVWAFFMIFFCLASVGLPGLNGFVSEFLTLIGAFASESIRIYAIIGASGLILGAIYILYLVGRIVLGPLKEPEAYAGKIKDLNGREIATLAPLAVACLVLGLYPTPMIDSMQDDLAGLHPLVQKQLDESRKKKTIENQPAETPEHAAAPHTSGVNR
jgi:NADH-quinone oxidoreductase subunit M